MSSVPSADEPAHDDEPAPDHTKRAELPPEVARIVRPLRAAFRGLAWFLVMNVLVALVIDLTLASRRRHAASHDLRPSLPNYADHVRANAIYAELDASWHYRPVVIEGWRRRPWRGRYVHIDARGRRYDPSEPQGPARTAHFFGGSTMWGTGVADDETIASQFAHRRRGWVSRNEGESGWVSRQGIDRLVNLLNQGEVPDAAIFYDGVNDAMYLCNGSLSINGHMREREEQNAPASDSEGLLSMRTLFAPEVFLWRFVTEARKVKAAATDRCETEDGADLVARTVVNNWTIAHDLMAARGRPFVGVLQPVAYIGHPRLDHLRGLPEDIGAGGRNINDVDRAFYVRVYGRLRARIAALGVPWLVDATDAFDSNEYTYIDYCHVSANGNAIIAARIDEALSRIGSR
jgi:lysophospholipase L1-like esterase